MPNLTHLIVNNPTLNV